MTFDCSDEFIWAHYLCSPAQEELRDQYLEAARLTTPENSLDPDVQCGLGVLLNLTGDYERAAECFQAALQARPQVMQRGIARNSCH